MQVFRDEEPRRAVSTAGATFALRVGPAVAWVLAISLGLGAAWARSAAQPNAEDPWTFACQRDEIAPRAWHDDDVQCNGESTLALAGGGRDFSNGSWVRVVHVGSETAVRFETQFLARVVEEIHRCVLARIIWQDAAGKQIGRAEYPATLRDETEDGWRMIRQAYRTPARTARARIELVYRWDPDGRVYFGGTRFEPTAPPPPRTVRLATIHHYPRNSRSARENLDRFARLVSQAAEQKADIVCLPEGVTMAGTGQTYVEASEPVPGPTTRYLGRLAKQLGLYIVAGIYERDGVAVYNTAVLVGRNGGLAGKYRKVCLPREEIEGGITPGDALPVFDTDFGRIGIMICWDVHSPEPAQTLARRGAEVILMPIWGGNLTLTKARAIENQIYLVTSSYDMKTAILDQEGEILAEGTDSTPVVVTEVDLSRQKLWPWLGDFKNRIPRERPTTRALR